MSRTLETILSVRFANWNSNGNPSKQDFLDYLNRQLDEEFNPGEFITVDLPEPLNTMFFSELFVGAVKRIDLRELTDHLKRYKWSSLGTATVDLFYCGEDMNTFRKVNIFCGDEDYDSDEDDEYVVLKSLDTYLDNN